MNHTISMTITENKENFQLPHFGPVFDVLRLDVIGSVDVFIYYLIQCNRFNVIFTNNIRISSKTKPALACFRSSIADSVSVLG